MRFFYLMSYFGEIVFVNDHRIFSVPGENDSRVKFTCIESIFKKCLKAYRNKTFSFCTI